MSESALYHVWEAAFDSPEATTVHFIPFAPAKVIRVGFVATEAVDGDPEVTIVHIQSDNSTALDPSGATHAGTMTIPTMAVGKGCYIDLTSSVTDAPIWVLPGEELAFTSDEDGTTGDGFLFVHYELMPFVDVSIRQEDLTIPGAVTNPTTLSNMTEVTS